MLEQDISSKNPKLHGVKESALEKCMFLWCRERRDRNEPISGPIIKEKAKLFNEQLGGSSNFQASEGWLSNFKNRHGLRALKMKGEKLSNNLEAADNFVQWINQYVEKHGYDWEYVYNADETGLAWKALPTNTLVMRNEKEAAGFKMPKDRLTVMVCTNATGSHKIPILVIGKSKNPRCFKNVSHLPVKYLSQKSAWMDRAVFREWYTNIFLPALKERKTGDERFLLILGNAPSHPDVEELNDIDSCCTVTYLPPNVTALIQPMNQGVIATMKKAYAQRFLRSMIFSSESGCNRIDFLKKWTVLECCHALSASWSSVKNILIQKAWKKINILPSPTATAAISESSSINLVQLANRALNDSLTEEEINRWVEDDSSLPTHRILSDEDILENFDNIGNLYEAQEEADNNETSCLNESSDDSDDEAVPTPNQVSECCKTLFRFFATQHDFKEEVFTLLVVIDDYVKDLVVQNI